MPWFRAIFLIGVLTLATGYKFRCWAFCVDQTSTQNDYVEQRDRCRDYAQLKLDMAMRDSSTGDDKNRKATLVSLFSECMGKNGWTVPDGKDGKPKGENPGPVNAVAAGPAAVQPAAANGQMAAPIQAAPAAAAAAAPDKAYMSRQAECAFARQAADSSSVSAARAKACDIECEQRILAEPDAPRPAACAAIHQDNLSSGFEQ